MKKGTKKILFIILSIFFGVSIISFSVISFTLCSFEKESSYLINNTGIILENQTIFIADSWWGNPNSMEVYLCPGTEKRDLVFVQKYYDKDSYNCSLDFMTRAESYNEILMNKTLKIDRNHLIVSERGFFCLGKSWRDLLQNE